jgi:hypothetical protein
VESIADVADGPWAGAEELDNLEAVGLGEGGERLVHDP